MKNLTKADNYKAYNLGLYGNKLKTWDNLDKLKASGIREGICVRYKVPGNNWTWFNIDYAEVLANIHYAIEEEFADATLFTFNEVGPDEQIVLQGEVMRSIRGLDLTYSQESSIMHRFAMKTAKHADGLQAVGLLQKHLSPSSYDDLMELLSLYQDSIIEFTTYTIDVGNCRGRNTIMWEVRNY